MSLLKLLGFGGPRSRRISRLAGAVRERLEHLTPERAEFVAAFAGLLVRVAHADNKICTAEHDLLRRLVAEHAGLARAEAETVAEIVTHHATMLAGIDYASLTRAFNELATADDKRHLIDCLYAMAAAGGLVSVVEDEAIRAVARSLLLSHAQLIAIRRRYKEQLEVIQEVRRLRRR